MFWAEVLWGLIAVVLMADAARIRRRLLSIPVLRSAEGSPATSHRFVMAPGVELSPSTRAAAQAHLAR